MTQPEPTIRVERAGRVATIVLSQPGRMNALTLDMWRQLAESVKQLGGDDSIRAVVLRGEGARAFSAGADISEFGERRSNSAQAKRYGSMVIEAIHAVMGLGKPTIAMIQGACTGGGCELAIATDIRIAARGSRFGIPVARIGVVVGYEELRRLIHLVGVGHASDLLLTGRLVDADEALALGLISRVVEPDDLERATGELVERIVAGSPSTHRWHKEMMQTILKTPDLAALSEEELDEQYACFDSPDFHEGYSSFLAKRPPVF